MRVRVVAASVLGIALGLVATRCSLTTSLDGLTGPDLEAGAGAVAVALADARAGDATTADGGDAAPDSSTDGGVDGGRFCASVTPAPSFCEDFDDEGPFTRWTSHQKAGGTVTRDRGAFRSAPNSLLCVAPASTLNGAAALFIQTPTVVHRVRYAYDFRVDARDTMRAYAEASYIRFGSPSAPRNGFYLRLYGDPTIPGFTAEAYLADGGVPQHNIPLVGNPTFAGWTRIVVDVDLRTATPSVSVTIDGVLAASTALEPSLYPPDVAIIEVGLGYAGATSVSAWKVRVDNVTVDWEP